MKKHVLTITAIALSAVAITMSWIGKSTEKRMAYFDYNTVYNDCELKKNLEKDLERVVSMRKSQLDSMQLELSLISEKINSGNTSQEELNAFEDMKNRFLTFKNQYEQENIRLKEEYFTQIRNLINDKSKEFAEAEGYDYLLAAVGDGSLMYAHENEDVTKEFLNYLETK